MNFSRTFRFIDRLCVARSTIFLKRSKKSFSFSEEYPILGRLIVTTPIDPVSGFAPKSPPPLFNSSLLSRRRRQHMDLASSGDMSELTKFEK